MITDDIRTNYHYVAIGFGGLFLIPQMLHGYKTGSLKDVSSIMLIFIIISTSLWGYYMYEEKYYLYMYAVGFICFNAITLILMQLWQYYNRFKKHVKTFESKSSKKNEEQSPILLSLPSSHPLCNPGMVQQISVAPDLQVQSSDTIEEVKVDIDV